MLINRLASQAIPGKKAEYAVYGHWPAMGFLVLFGASIFRSGICREFREEIRDGWRGADVQNGLD